MNADKSSMLADAPRVSGNLLTPVETEKTWAEQYATAWENLFDTMTADGQEEVLALPTGQLAGDLAARAWEAVEKGGVL